MVVMWRSTRHGDAIRRGRAPFGRRLSAFALLLAGLLLAPGAHALPTWTLGLTATDWDAPVFTLTNTSDAGELVTDLSILVGNDFYNFDTVLGTDPSEATTGATLVSPDRVQNNWWQAGGRTNEVAWTFTDFDPGEVFTFQVELDHDFALGGNVVDARDVLFNNDFWIFTNENALVSATFSDGSVVALTLPDGYAASYSFSSPGSSAPSVPEPSSALLLFAALLPLLWPPRPANQGAGVLRQPPAN
jgi:hypothetical protein